MAETYRSTKCALVAESVVGTPVAPSAATDFINVQTGFQITPEFEMLENAELTGIIGKAAGVQGLENVTAAASHYLRHSGVEAQAPNFNQILKSLFGSQGVNSTERLTTTASSTSVVKLAAGGTDFSKGKAILLKDGTNNYSVRNVYSVDTNDLTLAFNVANAPATGLGVGKCVYYGLTDTAPSFTLWEYLANGGCIEMSAGTKTLSASFEFPAAQPINASYDFKGTQYYHNPIVITATSKYIDFNEGASDLAAILTEGTYRDPEAMASEIQSKMDALATATITCTYSSATGKFTIVSNGATFNILWLTGTNNANGAYSKLGFTKADDTGAITYSSDAAVSWAAGFTPTIDTESFLVAKSNELMVGTATDYACLSASSVTVNFDKEDVDVMDICVTSGKSDTLFSGRSISIDVEAYLVKNDISKWLAFKNNTTLRFAYTCGRKSGSNWVAGSVVNLFSPTCKVASMVHAEDNGIVKLNFTLECFAYSGAVEFFMNML